MNLRYNLVGPPRHVPLMVRGRILFGGTLNQMGWLFFGFGMIFVWAFAFNADITSWYVFSGELDTASGTVTRSNKTGGSVGGSKHSKGTPIYANHYTFDAGDTRYPAGVERVYEGVSYATGRHYTKGHKVKVEFPKGRPEHSRIVGMRAAMWPALAVLVVIFPAVGLIFIAGILPRRRKAARLLAHGELTTGVLMSKKATSTRINEQRVYKLTFEFTVAGQTYEVAAKTHETEKLEDDNEEPLLYDPFNPANAVMLDHLPGEPRIDENGEVRLNKVAGTVLVLITPAATIIGNGLYAWYRVFG